MKILVYSSYDPESIKAAFGKPQYSYHFVLLGFLPALQRLGTVVRVRAIEEVDPIFDACQAEKQDCVFLCFAPPHLVPVTLRCPTIPVFAWEFTTFPCAEWSEDPRSDWRRVFRHCGRAITLSRHSAALVRQAMGPDFPVFSIPTGSYDAFAPLFHLKAGARKPREIRFHGFLYDTDAEGCFRSIAAWPLPPKQAAPPPVVPAAELPPEPPLTPRARLSLSISYGLAWYRHVLRDLMPGWMRSVISTAGGMGYRFYRYLLPLPAALAPPPAVVEAPPGPVEQDGSVQLSEIVYTAVFAPEDGRKNWHDLVTAFLWAFKDEKRATLLLKMPRTSWSIMHEDFVDVMGRFAPFACRVVLIYGYMEDAEYAALVEAADYYVNASSCEGLCIPLTEFLSAGVPAIAPDHTGMADYITPRLAFILRASLEHNVWPFDPREMFSTMRYRLDWDSLELAFRESFDVALNRGGAYAGMAQSAHEAMREFCSMERVQNLLGEALNTPALIAEYEAAE